MFHSLAGSRLLPKLPKPLLRWLLGLRRPLSREQRLAMFPTEGLPLTERAARSEITLPLFAHMTAAEQERVVSGLAAALER